MRKIVKIMIFAIIVLFVIFLILKFMPFNKSTYKSEQTGVKLKIPGFSSFKKECCMTSATFTSLRSSLVLKKELNDIMSDYEAYTCNNKIYYYDEKEDVTISEYGVEQGLLFNTFYITYDKGKRDANECSVMTDYKKIKYNVIPVNETGYCHIRENLKYRDSDNNLNNLFYECFGDLAIENGRGKMIILDNMLQYEWISMDTIINSLEYQVEQEKALKKTYGENVLYKNNDFSLLQCKTTNKDIYISSTNFEYNEEYCK